MRSPGLDWLVSKLREMSGHCLTVVRNENAALFGGDIQYRRVGNPSYTAFPCAQKVYGSFSSSEANNYLVIEVGVREKPWSHLIGV